MSDSQAYHIPMNRKGFGLREAARETVKDSYGSDIIEEIKKSGYSKTYGRVTVRLAKEFGFCYGVDRAVELAYETCERFPDRRLFLTTEIIHNPTVNQDLMQKGVRFLNGSHKNAEFSEIKKEDIVIVPAFGTTVEELEDLRAIGCTLVDTICGSVVNVWKRVEKYAQEGYTSIIHGKFNHEETLATASRVAFFPGAQYLILYNKDDAQFVCDYIEKGGSKEEFMNRFGHAVSEGFDPDQHLDFLGCANQTTMLSSESLEIAGMFDQVLSQKFATDDKEHFRSFDTICSATQERQDAISEMKAENPDVILVIGGYNSSNTGHLQEIAETFSKSFHINCAESLIDATTVVHKPYGQAELATTKDWLPSGNIKVGITAGASTPNRVMGDVIARVLNLANQS